MISSPLANNKVTQASGLLALSSENPASPRDAGYWWVPYLFLLSRIYNKLRLWGLRTHTKSVRSGERALSKISGFTGEHRAARAFTYLRLVQSCVFEEMTLSALEKGGRLVRRNKRYTGDGGEDGRFYEPGVGWIVIQCKRYKSYVSAKDVHAFGALIKKTGCAGGIFVHCGKTGELSWSHAAVEECRISIVSGQAMLNLLINGRLKPLGSKIK